LIPKKNTGAGRTIILNTTGYESKNEFHGKYYNAYSDFIKRKYGQRVQKVTVDAGFTCPIAMERWPRRMHLL